MPLALSVDHEAEPAGPLVNMRQLAVRLAVSRQTLTVWLDKWPDFPIVARGSNGREYSFDAAVVFAFLRGKKQAQASAAAERDQALSQLALPFALDDTAPATAPGLSVRDQVEALKLRRLQREEAERSGQLVEAAQISDQLTTALIGWNRALHNALRQAGREHNLPDSLVRALDARLVDTQRSFVRELGRLAVQFEDADAP